MRRIAAHTPTFAARAACVVALFACAVPIACSSTPESQVAPIYRELRSDLELGTQEDADEAELRERQRAREQALLRLLDAHPPLTADDHWMAAVVLLESDDLELLGLAQRLALEAADLGAEIGKRVAAEACDRELVKRGMHQRYGTQFFFDDYDGRWHLYPVDPRSTDEDRRAMGVAPIEELRREEARLNGG